MAVAVASVGAAVRERERAEPLGGVNRMRRATAEIGRHL